MFIPNIFSSIYTRLLRKKEQEKRVTKPLGGSFLAMHTSKHEGVHKTEEAIKQCIMYERRLLIPHS